MAMIKCKECKSDISSNAVACPKCGAKVPQSIGAIKMIGFAIVASICFPVFYSCGTVMNKFGEAGDKLKAEEDAKSPAQKVREAQERLREEAQSSIAMDTVALVKKHAKNPDSVKFSYLGVNSDSNLVCGTYRATNSFNAVVPGVVVVRNHNASFSGADAKKYCENAALTDFTHFSR